jgi:stearoyl-CoA desaturase (delta-9 desaturase)
MSHAEETPPLIATVREHTSWPSRIITFAAVAGPPFAVLSVMGILWGVAVRPVDVILLVSMYLICGLGISIGYHRYFTHAGFETRPWFRGLLAILGAMTLQGPVSQWVTDHRKHHALSDQPGDPHSPHTDEHDGWVGTVFGLWHSHVGWLFTTKGMEVGPHYGKDLLDDRQIRVIDQLYLVWLALTFLIPFGIGYLVGGGSLALGFEAFVWGGLLRIFLFQHTTWAVNSVCHTYGKKAFKTRDESRNNVVIAIATFGEGWHNNHHAFPSSAVHGLLPGQFDLSAHLIAGLEKAGVIWNVKRPDAAALERRRVADAAA